MPEEHPSNPIRDTQARFNRSTETHWSHFAAHRRQVESLLHSSLFDQPAHPSGRLCVLGAGNCNDLDLRRLVGRFEEVHLVDIDADALARAVRRQEVADLSSIRRHAPIDLTALADTLAAWSRRSPSAAEVDRCLAEPVAAIPAELAAHRGSFDVVLSPCILSQISGFARDVLGERHPRAAAVRDAIRQRHLRLIVDLTAPGGSGVLVSDMAVAGAPGGFTGDRRRNGPPDLDSVARKLAHQRECFAGLSPDSLLTAIESDPTIAPLLAAVHLVRPWLWVLGPEKTFLVFALRLRRSATTIVIAE